MHRRHKHLTIFLFLLPALVLFVGILVWPIIASVHHSMFEYRSFTEPGNFVGLQNYKDLFNSQYDFGKAVINALILAALSVFIQLPLALGLALMLGNGIKGERFYLSVYFTPVLISAVVIGMLWEKIYNPIYGLVTKTFEWLNMADKLPPAGLLGDPKTALLAVFIPTIWQYVGYHMLLMYAGIKGVSPELREAAMLDGATRGQVNRYVVIPTIKPIIKVSIIFAITGSLKSYDLIKVFAKDAYNCSYKVPSLLLVRYAFHNAGGIASAIAVIMIIMCFFFAILINWMFKERDLYGKK
ncbi:MAG: sugar ABC transporter permease [Lachnospiraceae bacterium]|nr:sugar ABC transporter permease [Lachnospiraceae bacterium]